MILLHAAVHILEEADDGIKRRDDLNIVGFALFEFHNGTLIPFDSLGFFFAIFLLFYMQRISLASGSVSIHWQNICHSLSLWSLRSCHIL